MNAAEKSAKVQTLRDALAALEGTATDEEIAEARAAIAARKAAPPPPSPEETARAAAIAALTAPKPTPGRRPTEHELLQAAVAAGLAHVASREAGAK